MSYVFCFPPFPTPFSSLLTSLYCIEVTRWVWGLFGDIYQYLSNWMHLSSVLGVLELYPLMDCLPQCWYFSVGTFMFEHVRQSCCVWKTLFFLGATIYDLQFLLIIFSFPLPHRSLSLEGGVDENIHLELSSLVSQS